MSVTAPAGFAAAGVAAGLKSSGALDLALVVNQGPRHAAAAVFTSNRAQANPIIWSQQVVADGQVAAIVLNSGGANCFTGPQGFQTTHATAEAVAEHCDVSAGDVLVCSTGLIGEQLNRDAVISGVKAAAGALGSHGDDAARAIMTTDSVPKTVVIEGPGYSIGGMAKGAGMLAPGLATMLAVLTTDAELPASELDRALRTATRVSFERLDSDGCMSTNDQVTLMASGASGITPDTDAFTLLLIDACMALTRQLQADAEGASHEIMITVTGAVSEADAVEVARSVARSNLFKAAMFGNDPNWGRVLAAIGTTQAAFNPYAVDVSFNGVRLCHAGAPDRPRTDVDLSGRIVEVLIELTAGTELATVYTNDLTHDYVHENSAYSS
jgi:glutamate N-acetyltransferase/amino-acid N-acetyltransferase